MLLLTISKMPALSRSFQRTWLNSCVRLTSCWSTDLGGKSGTASLIFGAPRLMPVLIQSCWLRAVREDRREAHRHRQSQKEGNRDSMQFHVCNGLRI